MSLGVLKGEDHIVPSDKNERAYQLQRALVKLDHNLQGATGVSVCM